MIVNFKTLQQKSFQIDVEPSVTVGNLKKSIQEVQDLNAESQKLIFKGTNISLIIKGKILTDDVTVGDIGVTDKDFVVVMVTKPKPAPTPVAPAPVAAPVAPVVPATPTPAAAPTTVPAETTFSESTLLTGSSLESTIANLVEMGFPRDQCVAAMRAAFNNPDRAVEYLMTGIPESARVEAAPAPTPAAAPSPATPAAPTPTSAGGYVNLFQQAAAQAQSDTAPPAATGTTPNSLEFLRTSPQFQQLRQMVQTNPELLQPLLAQLGQTNPNLVQLISNNQDQFLQMLAEGSEGGAPGGEYITVTITAEEEAAVNRLTELGFARDLAVEAFLACDRNEELAANYLFEMGANE
ncbi:XPC-binding domain-containing protein [Globomyces pollinis-pini]|nr:XPC-binding domain-containing protein [Globomyces pollinis-pini]